MRSAPAVMERFTEGAWSAHGGMVLRVCVCVYDRLAHACVLRVTTGGCGDAVEGSRALARALAQRSEGVETCDAEVPPCSGRAPARGPSFSAHSGAYRARARRARSEPACADLARVSRCRRVRHVARRFVLGATGRPRREVGLMATMAP